MRSDTAFFSAADISRRFLAGLASGLLSVAAVAFVGEEARRDVERAVGAGAARICSTSVNALIFIVMKIKAGELLDFDLHRECRDCDTDSMRRVLPCLPPDVW